MIHQWKIIINICFLGKLNWIYSPPKLCQTVSWIIWNGLLNHWGRVTHICVSKLTIIGSDNGLSPDRCQAIIWTSAGLLLIGPLGKNFSEILIKILTFSLKKMRLKVSSAQRRPFCLGLNVLNFCVISSSCSIIIFRTYCTLECNHHIWLLFVKTFWMVHISGYVGVTCVCIFSLVPLYTNRTGASSAKID